MASNSISDFTAWLETKKNSGYTLKTLLDKHGYKLTSDTYNWCHFASLTTKPTRGLKLEIFNKLYEGWLSEKGFSVIAKGQLGGPVDPEETATETEPKFFEKLLAEFNLKVIDQGQLGGPLEAKEAPESDEAEPSEPSRDTTATDERPAVVENTLIKMVTWNIRHLCAAEQKDSLRRMATFLANHDIACLQEVASRSSNIERLDNLRSLLDYKLVLGTEPRGTLSSSSRPLLNAILFNERKLELLESTVLRASPHPTVVAYLRERTSGSEVVISSIHLPYTSHGQESVSARTPVAELGKMLDAQRKSIINLMAAWNVDPSVPMILAGDFNHDPAPTLGTLQGYVAFPGKDVGTSMGNSTLDGFVVRQGDFRFRCVDYQCEPSLIPTDHHPVVLDMGVVTSKKGRAAISKGQK